MLMKPGLTAEAPLGLNGVFVDETGSDFRVATDAYRRADVFEVELRKIFYSTWVYLGHESEFSKPGDFKSTWIGLQPVIVVRDAGGGINAFLNFCRHRGAGLVREEYGNAKMFACPYHGWTFRTSGELMGIVDRSRFPDDFPVDQYGLIRVARVESYGGLVFGSFNPSVPSLVEHLAPVREHIDLWLGRCAGGRYRVGAANKYAYHGNWKYQAENIYDGYHAHFVHGAAYRTFRKFENAFTGRDPNPIRTTGQTRGYPGGHGVLEAGGALDNRFLDDRVRKGYLDQLLAVHGSQEKVGRVLENRHLLIFPSVVLMDALIRVIQPRAHNRTEVYSYPMLIDGVHDDLNSQRLHDTQTRVGAAGIVGPDDIEVFNSAQTAQLGEGAAWITLARGLTLEKRGPDGETLGAFTDEAPQRAFWRHWRSIMTQEAR